MNNNTYFQLFKTLVAKHNLSIKPIAYKLINNTPTFYFTAPQPVDFRKLVAELNKTLGAKSHLQQIGPRRCAKFQGGIGCCGRALCCKQWLPSFPQVTSEIIQNQKVDLEISQHLGPCGKPLCCLAFEAKEFKLKEQEQTAKAEQILPKKEQPKKEVKEVKAETISHTHPISAVEAKKARKQKIVRRVLKIKKLKKKK